MSSNTEVGVGFFSFLVWSGIDSIEEFRREDKSACYTGPPLDRYFTL